MDWTNRKIARLLREVAAAYSLKNANRFQIAAYENAADAIEHATSEVKDIWEQGGLETLPGIGEKLHDHLDELMRTGQVRHFNAVKRGIPEGTFPLLEVPGIGPKTALKLAKAGVTGITDLERRMKREQLQSYGWSPTVAAKILRGIAQLKRREDRLLFPVAAEIARGILIYLRKHPNVYRADPVGSLRRRVATIGDIDIAAATDNPKGVIDHFVNYSGSAGVEEKGDENATIVLTSGVRVDLMVQTPESYGSLLQHSTGSKQHNVHLRLLAMKHGLSISEHGVKKIKSRVRIACPKEGDIYRLLQMDTPPPELREDNGEIGGAQRHTLPHLIGHGDIQGDLHMHSIYSDGRESIFEMVRACAKLGYAYIAMSDHAYPRLDFTGRHREIERVRKQSTVHILEALEVNITTAGKLQVSDDILKRMDWNIAAIHTGFDQGKEEMTSRLLFAIAHPLIHAIAHPTGRLLLERDGYEANWEAVFTACAKYKKFLEINGYPNRLDLTDTLVRQAKDLGVTFVITTDAHQRKDLANMEYGVAVARRGWLTKHDVANTLPFKEFFGKIKK